MITIGLTTNHYQMIIGLIDRHIDELLNVASDEIVISEINEWLDVLRAFNDPDELEELIREYESILDDIANGY